MELQVVGQVLSWIEDQVGTSFSSRIQDLESGIVFRSRHTLHYQGIRNLIKLRAFRERTRIFFRLRAFIYLDRTRIRTQGAS